MSKNSLYNKSDQSILLSKISNSKQNKDLTLPPNCNGFGRVHHFRQSNVNWIGNPLPQNPVSKFFNVDEIDVLKVQVFQIAKCNFDCWYCFVDKKLRVASSEFSDMITVNQMISSTIENNLNVIDLSGGQPDLAPQWPLWLLRRLNELSLSNKIFVWQDDNLSNWNMFDMLSDIEIKELSLYQNYSRVGCFKGFDELSYSFNTEMPPKRYNDQFDIYKDLLNEGFDMYSYVTFTCDSLTDIEKKIISFIERLRLIHVNLPLRTIPLEIMHFSPMGEQLESVYERAIENQYVVLKHWNNALKVFYSEEELDQEISLVEMR
ncbi:MAG: 4Fe-4S cluster-binding domain-containing protein [Clostridiales bacterium]|nr:4Fe-4S cluster-binding domain-containing protein [Clostridiales bacterium]